MSYAIKQGQTSQPLMFLLVATSDHISGLTAATPVVTLSKNGGSFASPAGAVSEVGSGWYKVAGNAADAGTLGPLVLHATAAGADASDVTFPVIATDPLSASSVPPSASVIAAAVWQDATPGDFAVANSPGLAMASLAGAFDVATVLSTASTNILTVDFGVAVSAGNFAVGCYCLFLAGSRANPSKVAVQAATQGVTSSQVVLVLSGSWAAAPAPGDKVSVG